MTVALIAESGVRLVDVPSLLPELRVAVGDKPRVRWLDADRDSLPIMTVPTYRRFVRMDDHTYVEKD